ncbi:Translation initiation factor 3 subunit c, partial [Cryomyces antarcticus]
FDKLNQKIPTVMRNNDGKVPKMYIKAIADLETFMIETVEKQKVTPKKMTPANTRGLNAVRQRTRKNNKDYAKEIELYREDKDEYMKEDAPEETAPVAKKPKRTTLDVGDVAGAGDEGFTMVGAGGKAVVYTPESILKHLREIVESRGRKNTDRAAQIKTMDRLLEVAMNDYQRIRVLLTLVATRFDLSSGSGNQMPQEQWRLAQANI